MSPRIRTPISRWRAHLRQSLLHLDVVSDYGCMCEGTTMPLTASAVTKMQFINHLDWRGFRNDEVCRVPCWPWYWRHIQVQQKRLSLRRENIKHARSFAESIILKFAKNGITFWGPKMTPKSDPIFWFSIEIIQLTHIRGQKWGSKNGPKNGPIFSLKRILLVH